MGLLVGHCISQPANLERAALTVTWGDSLGKWRNNSLMLMHAPFLTAVLISSEGENQTPRGQDREGNGSWDWKVWLLSEGGRSLTSVALYWR